MGRRRNVHIHLTADYDPSEPRKGKGPGGGEWTKGAGGGPTQAQGRGFYAKLTSAGRAGAGAQEYAEEERALMEEEEAEEHAAGFHPYPSWRKGGEQAIFEQPIGKRTGGATHIHVHGISTGPQAPPATHWVPLSLAGHPFVHGPSSGATSRLNSLRDDPSLTSEQVAATTPASQIAELNETRAHIKRDKMRGDTQAKYHDPATKRAYTRDRRHLQRAIMKKGRRGIDSEHPGQTKFYEGLLSPEAISRATPLPGQQPEFTMLGGRGGSGKSWFKDKLYDSQHALVLDADVIKHMLPEYTGDNAWEVHEESSDILDRVLRFARRHKLNVVLDATMKTRKGVMAKGNAFKRAGYKVNAHYMHLPRLKAAQRAIDRRFSPGIKAAKEGGDPSLRGRYVDPDIILENVDNEKNFEELTQIADTWSAWDNDVPRDTPPKLIERGGNF
jgi:predicted ABC-type ATPase